MESPKQRINRILVSKVYTNKRNGQMTVTIPKKKLKTDLIGKKLWIQWK